MRTPSSVYICLPCSRTPNAVGRLTTESAYEAAMAHGCRRLLKPKGKLAKTYVKWAVPRVLTAKEWRTVWDSLTESPAPAKMCRSKRGSCGHVEATHFFSSVTQPWCRGNCVRC